MGLSRRPWAVPLTDPARRQKRFPMALPTRCHATYRLRHAETVKVGHVARRHSGYKPCYGARDC